MAEKAEVAKEAKEAQELMIKLIIAPDFSQGFGQWVQPALAARKGLKPEFSPNLYPGLKARAIISFGR